MTDKDCLYLGDRGAAVTVGREVHEVILPAVEVDEDLKPNPRPIKLREVCPHASQRSDQVPNHW